MDHRLRHDLIHGPEIVNRQRGIQFTNRIANRAFQRPGLIRGADDKTYVGPEKLIRNLAHLEVKFGTGRLIHTGVFGVFNHPNDGAPHFRVLKSWIHAAANRTAGPEPFRECLVDNNDRHRVWIVVLWLKGATLQQPDLHRLEVIVANDIPVVDVLRRTIGCLLVAFDLGVVSVDAS